MKKLAISLPLLVIIFTYFCSAASAAVINDTVKVGIRTGSNALFSANLQNEIGEGYSFGTYNSDREFDKLGFTDEIKISMTAAGQVFLQDDGTYSSSGGGREIGRWHLEQTGFDSFKEALNAAESEGGYPAYIDWEYVVRVGCFSSEEEAQEAADEMDLEDAEAVRSGSTGILVTVTGTDRVIFEFDCHGGEDLAVLPQGGDPDEVQTWFKGYQYSGGFEYQRITGGNINVLNVVDLETYVKGVVPFEMSNSWPSAALEAQAVCARSFVCGNSKHNSAGYDVCNTTDCQVYYGHGGGKTATENSDRAVESTEGIILYYQGEPVKSAVYHSSDGGATEDAANVWGSKAGYLIGKADPFEAMINIPSYTYTVTYSASEISWILQQKGYSIGTVQDISITELTPMGNVKKVTFTGTDGVKTVSGDTCRTIFYSSTYNKSVKSLRYRLNGEMPPTTVTAPETEVPQKDPVQTAVYRVNRNGTIRSISGAFAISGKGDIQVISGDTPVVQTADGQEVLMNSTSLKNASGSFTISGTGSGHNVGMSQYGAKAMAEQGYDYEEILSFYFTDVELRSR